MIDYQKYINALRKCAKEHEDDKKFTGHIIVSDLCRDTANLLEELEQESRWIPVTEKLPDAGEDVLVTVNLGSVRVVGVDMYSLVEKDGFEGYGKDVIAWMSLPQPYKPQESEEV